VHVFQVFASSHKKWIVPIYFEPVLVIPSILPGKQLGFKTKSTGTSCMQRGRSGGRANHLSLLIISIICFLVCGAISGRTESPLFHRKQVLSEPGMTNDK
jgi:hypothetical protein